MNATFKPVMTKARKHYPATATEYETAVVPGMFIGVRSKNRDGSYTEPKLFKVGDVVEYDSYNLSYMGTITKITAKTVTVDKGLSYSKNKRMDLHSFAFRNYDFDALEMAKKNSETMMYI